MISNKAILITDSTEALIKRYVKTLPEGCKPENLHGIMYPVDNSHLTLEFSDHFVIKPTIQFSGYVDFSVNKLGKKGKSVEQGFEYNPGKNPHFLSTEEIVELNHLAVFK